MYSFISAITVINPVSFSLEVFVIRPSLFDERVLVKNTTGCAGRRTPGKKEDGNCARVRHSASPPTISPLHPLYTFHRFHREIAVGIEELRIRPLYANSAESTTMPQEGPFQFDIRLGSG